MAGKMCLCDILFYILTYVVMLVMLLKSKKTCFTSSARSWVQHAALLSRHCQYLYFSFCKYGFLFHCKVFPALYFPYFSKTISHQSLLDSCYQNLRSIKPLVAIILFSNNKWHGEVKQASSYKFGDFSNCNLPLIYQMYRLGSISS